MTRIMRGRSTPRMKLLVHASQKLAIDVGIDLRGRDVGVPKHFLDRPQVGAAFEKVGREGVTERVRRHSLLDPGAIHVLAKELPCSHPREWLASRIEKQHSLPLSPFEPRPKLTKIHGHRSNGAPPDRYKPFLGPLPEHANETLLEQDIPRAEGDPL